MASATSSFPPSGDCGQLLAAGGAVSAVLGNRFPGQPLPFSEASSLTCFRSYVAPLLFNWLDAWQDAVRRSSCPLLPFVWMEEVRQQAASSCPAALATWHSKQGSLEEPRYMAFNATVGAAGQACGSHTAWPSSKLDFLWRPNTGTPNASTAALNAASVSDGNVFLPRRLSNETLISGVLNRFSRRWGTSYQANSVPATAADPLANLTINPTCVAVTKSVPDLNLYGAIRANSNVTWGQRALLPDDVLAGGCMAGKVREMREQHAARLASKRTLPIDKLTLPTTVSLQLDVHGVSPVSQGAMQPPARCTSCLTAAAWA